MNYIRTSKIKGLLMAINSNRIRFFNTQRVCSFFPEKPPSHFQDYKNLPLTFDQIEKTSHQNFDPSTFPPRHSTFPSSSSSSSLSPMTSQITQQAQLNQPLTFQNGEAKKLSIGDLFRMKETRGAAWRLLMFTNMIGLAILAYTYYNIAIENLIIKDELLDTWYKYDQKDISQTIMAIHIAMLRKQLLDVGVVPKPSNIAVETALNQLIFERDEDGRLLIYVNTKYPLFDLVPFHSEYSTSKVAKFKNA